MAEPAKPTPFRGGWRVRWTDHEGTRRVKAFRAGEHNAAVKYLAARRTETEDVRAGRRRAPPRVEHTFGELLDYYERERVPLKRSGSDALSIIRAHLRPAFGAVKLRDFGTEHLDRFKRERAHLAPNTVRNVLSLVSVVWKLARKLGWIGFAIEIERPRSELAGKVDPADRPRLRSRDEVQRFLAAAHAVGAELYPERPTFLFTLYATAILTMLRQGELAGLRWGDVDLTKRSVYVQRSFNGRTKTVQSRRTVPIVDDLLPVLRAWHEANGKPEGDAPVFPNGAGNVLDPAARAFQEHLHATLDRAEFPRPKRTGRVGVAALHFHSLRHSGACLWMESGGDINRLQAVMGHVSKDMTRYYAHTRGYAHPDDFARMRGLLARDEAPANVVALRR